MITSRSSTLPVELLQYNETILVLCEEHNSKIYHGKSFYLFVV